MTRLSTFFLLSTEFVYSRRTFLLDFDAVACMMVLLKDLTVVGLATLRSYALLA